MAAIAVLVVVSYLAFIGYDVLGRREQFDSERILFHAEKDSLEFKAKDREPNEFEDLKFLFFGTSRTYGTLLKDRLNEAFPFLLSPHTTNLAIPGSTPTFPCKCAESMIRDVGKEDEAFDVIILEFDRPFFLETVWLVHRLRQRYPKAHIIILELWLLSYIFNIRSDQYLNQWADQEGFETHGDGIMGDRRLAYHLKTNTDVTDWDLKFERFQYSQEEIHAFQEEDAVVLPIPIPRNARHAVRDMSHHFFNDMNHYSITGHRLIRDLILRELRQAHFRTTPALDVNPWQSPDSCTSWFRTGEVPVPYSDTFTLDQFKPGKYALETNAESSWVEVDNTMGEEAELYMERMVTSPDCMYPRMIIQVVGSNEKPAVAGCDKLPWPWGANVARGLYIGTIPPGKSRVEFKKDPTDSADAPWPFRLLGITITAKGNSISKSWSTLERYS